MEQWKVIMEVMKKSAQNALAFAQVPVAREEF